MNDDIRHAFAEAVRSAVSSNPGGGSSDLASHAFWFLIGWFNIRDVADPLRGEQCTARQRWLAAHATAKEARHDQS